MLEGSLAFINVGFHTSLFTRLAHVPGAYKIALPFCDSFGAYSVEWENAYGYNHVSVLSYVTILLNLPPIVALIRFYDTVRWISVQLSSLQLMAMANITYMFMTQSLSFFIIIIQNTLTLQFSANWAVTICLAPFDDGLH